MNAVNDNSIEQTDWPKRKPKKVKRSLQIRDAKVKGLEHINHKNKLVPARITGGDCRYVHFIYYYHAKNHRDIFLDASC